jgi:hypothetical protein
MLISIKIIQINIMSFTVSNSEGLISIAQRIQKLFDFLKSTLVITKSYKNKVKKCKIHLLIQTGKNDEL